MISGNSGRSVGSPPLNHKSVTAGVFSESLTISGQERSPFWFSSSQ
jgi:hypothetical protein